MLFCLFFFVSFVSSLLFHISIRLDCTPSLLSQISLIQSDQIRISPISAYSFRQMKIVKLKQETETEKSFFLLITRLPAGLLTSVWLIPSTALPGKVKRLESNICLEGVKTPQLQGTIGRANQLTLHPRTDQKLCALLPCLLIKPCSHVEGPCSLWPPAAPGPRWRKFTSRCCLSVARK